MLILVLFFALVFGGAYYAHIHNIKLAAIAADIAVIKGTILTTVVTDKVAVLAEASKVVADVKADVVKVETVVKTAAETTVADVKKVL